MAKTRLTGEKRAAIIAYMQSRFDEREDRATKNEAFRSLLTMVNAAIREKFPEEDMAVLRKYKLVESDRCLRFHQPSNGRFIGIDFYYGTEGLCDLPSMRGCRSREVFIASDELAGTFETWQREKKKNKEDRAKKVREYAAFVEASKTVEDVEEVVPLPADLRRKREFEKVHVAMIRLMTRRLAAS